MSLLVFRGGFNLWPELLQFLTQCLSLDCFGENLKQNEENILKVENSIHTVAMIVEDCTKMFEDQKFRTIVTEMFPSLCKLIDPRYNQFIVHHGINTINMLLLTNCDIVRDSMADYFHVLLNLGAQLYQDGASFQNQKVKWRVVQGLTTIMELNIQLVVDNFETVCELMIRALMLKDQ
jgi:hypothetical protein